jgi:hypothetical protein
MTAPSRSHRFQPGFDRLSLRIAPSGLSPLDTTVVLPGLPTPPAVTCPLQTTLIAPAYDSLQPMLSAQ